MIAELAFIRAELIDRAGAIELVFVDRADGAEWRVPVKANTPFVPQRQGGTLPDATGPSQPASPAPSPTEPNPDQSPRERT